ncbi:MAG: hypothetical protein AAB778_00540 [Patescibacteria group bacterium]
MNILSQENINYTANLFLLMGGIITFFGSIVVYLDRKTKLSKLKKKRK